MIEAINVVRRQPDRSEFVCISQGSRAETEADLVGKEEVFKNGVFLMQIVPRIALSKIPSLLTECPTLN